MNKTSLTLNQLQLNSSGRVRAITAISPLRHRLLDLGLINDTIVKALHRGPAGDPTAYQIRGAVIALRAEDAACIIIDPVN
ncbi:MAG: ferrous iron transport protein A [Firmicutes bacterium]|jgi:ferrous iron transport protein A|nr:ferrous iron transport protein A [Bacillota bacterium]